LDKSVEFVEIKRNPSRIDLNKLESKAAYFLQNTKECKGYSITYKGLSLENM